MGTEGVIEGVCTDCVVCIKRVSIRRGGRGGSTLSTVTDPDPQTRGAIIKTLRLGEGPGLKKNIFSALQVSVWSKNKGSPQAPWAPPLDPLLIYYWCASLLRI